MGSLSEYACPLCGRKVKDHLGKDCLFVHDSEIGAIICGFCKSAKMKLKREENLKGGKIDEYRRKLGIDK